MSMTPKAPGQAIQFHAAPVDKKAGDDSSAAASKAQDNRAGRGSPPKSNQVSHVGDAALPRGSQRAVRAPGQQAIDAAASAMRKDIWRELVVVSGRPIPDLRRELEANVEDALVRGLSAEPKKIALAQVTEMLSRLKGVGGPETKGQPQPAEPGAPGPRGGALLVQLLHKHELNSAHWAPVREAALLQSAEKVVLTHGPRVELNAVRALHDHLICAGPLAKGLDDYRLTDVRHIDVAERAYCAKKGVWALLAKAQAQAQAREQTYYLFHWTQLQVPAK